MIWFLILAATPVALVLAGAADSARTNREMQRSHRNDHT